MGCLWAYKSEVGGGGGGGMGGDSNRTKQSVSNKLRSSADSNTSNLIAFLIVVKNRHVPDTFDVKLKNRNHETIRTDFTLNRQRRSLVNWAACKAVSVHKMGFSPSKNEHYQLLTQHLSFPGEGGGG